MEEIIDDIGIKNVSKLFYQMLNDYKEDDNENVCYISGDLLNETYITLHCNHKFNYNEIYKEVLNQKLNKHTLNVYLGVDKIQCPYCRKIQNGILPYCSNTKKSYGVNYPECYTMKGNSCEYIYRSGKNKNNKCEKECYYSMCSSHLRYLNKPTIENGCNALLKSGKNKGKKCGCKVYENGLCKRHHNC